MQNTLLWLHLIGAGLTLGALLVGWARLFLGQLASVKPWASVVGVMGGLQLLSGSALAWTTTGSVWTFCSRVGLYLLVLVVTEAVFYLALRQTSNRFPFQTVTWSLSTGSVVAMCTALYLS